MANVGVLEQLRRVVRDAPDEQFRMSTWLRTDQECGTVACAAGWAYLDPWHQANTRIKSVFTRQDNGHMGMSDDMGGVGELADIYEITPEQADRLFVGYDSDEELEDITKEMVIAKIDDLIAGRRLTPY